LKVDRLRIILRHFNPCIFGLRSLQLSSTRFTRRESPAIASSAALVPEKAPAPQKEVKETKEEKKEPQETKKVEKKEKTPRLPFKGVTIVISGIGNPERSEIRSKACKLGAAYSANWDKKSTHLICSTFNQQKCLQAQNDKKPIVTPKWVHDCYKKQTRLKEDQYLLQKPSKRTRRNTRRSTSPKRTYAEFSDDDLSDISASLSDVSEDADWNSEEEEQPPKKRAKKNDPTMGGDWGITENPKVKAKNPMSTFQWEKPALMPKIVKVMQLKKWTRRQLQRKWHQRSQLNLTPVKTTSVMLL